MVIWKAAVNIKYVFTRRVKNLRKHNHEGTRSEEVVRGHGILSLCGSGMSRFNAVEIVILLNP